MKLINLKTRIAAILPDERNPMTLTWAEFLSVLFIVVVAVLAVVAVVASRLYSLIGCAEPRPVAVALVSAVVTNEIERGNTVVIAGNGFAIDDAGA
jgi:hypothetical protein